MEIAHPAEGLESAQAMTAFLAMEAGYAQNATAQEKHTLCSGMPLLPRRRQNDVLELRTQSSALRGVLENKRVVHSTD